MSFITSMDAYSPIGDLVTIAICWVLFILMFCSYIRRTRSFRIFLFILGFLLLAANASVTYRTLLSHWQPSLTVLIYITRIVMHTSMFAIFHLFVVYIGDVAHLSAKERRFSSMVAGILLMALFAYDVIGTLTGAVFRIDESGAVHTGLDVFSFGYLAFVAVNTILMIRVRSRLYMRVMVGFFATVVLAVGLNLLQRLNGQSSFTVVSFLFPVLAMLYFMHSNPYDTQLGSIDGSALDDLLRYYRSKNQTIGYMSLYMHTFEEDHAPLPEGMQLLMRKAAAKSFRGSVLFQVSPGYLILVYPKKKNPNDQAGINDLMSHFREEHKKYRLDYKIVIGHSMGREEDPKDYIAFIRNIMRNMRENSVHIVDKKDGIAFDRYEYILRELGSIYSAHDLDDPRVLVYCQPVYNLELQRYDTAEALMRLKLDQAGIVYPDEFIQVAEANGFIHVLTEIILYKTCEAITLLTEAGFRFSRISVNVAAQELKDGNFCSDIIRILDNSRLSGDRIALELTESENESNFRILQSVMAELKKQGIEFYLDDFGTGYSSMERIMQLPFDIIKFDRSLVIASRSNAKSAAMVRSMAQLFRELNYSVLYEGVEDEADEDRCGDMSASYLQGYKYSRPVPILELKHFFTKVPA